MGTIKTILYTVFLAAASSLPTKDSNASHPKSSYLKPTTHKLANGLISRIINGTEAPPHSIPFQVYLTIIADAPMSWQCGGSLISPRHVLTAAHCLINGVVAKVLLGAHNIKESESTQIVVESRNLIPHEDYSEALLTSDIGLIVLDEEVELNDNVNIVALPSRNITSNYEGAKVQVSGWGYYDTSNASSPVLLEANSTVISNSECEKTFGTVPSCQLCISGVEGIGSCNGDSGGPLVTNNVQIGIVSYSFPECQAAAALSYGYDEVFPDTNYLEPSFDRFIEDIDPRIVNGTEAVPHSHPYQAYIVVTSADSEAETWNCGGSLISPKHVLTAAHCLIDGVSATVYLGAHNISEIESTQVIFDTKNLIPNKNYENYVMTDDIGVIVLDREVELNDYINVVALPFRNISTDYEGANVTITGWGYDTDANGTISSVLLEADSTVISNTECEQSFGFVPSNQLCISGENEISSCTGDAGGPLVSNNVLIGIIGGKEATPHSLPFQAFLSFTDDAKSSWICGGSLITTSFILTSARCGYKASSVEVTLGAHNISVAETTQIKFQSQNIKIHESFKNDQTFPGYVYENDIALIALPEAVLSEAIQPVQLASRNESYVNVTGKVSGWGLIDAYNTTISPVLLSQENIVISNEECAFVYYDLKDYDICMATMVEEQSPCVGDYGSPLIVDKVQVGVASQGVMYCIPGYPFVYTRVAMFLDWIEANSDYKE
ncbi:hypothetical protein NQ315_016431 [Exocentrus adspersus]|uniref:Peptidase S1 domain-containing protein n=1 Tax=Exocentrus adspersus TaxID=1586481 RepID=A0AAV8VQB1_9CUCU|nr:hypothetical protein NQ315_016431 [Exocentrus adspersus]